MFPSLAKAIRDLEVPVDGRALRTLLALHDRLTAKLAHAIGEFDEARLWDETCATSMKMWLVDEGYAPTDAHRTTMIAKRMRQLPTIAAAWETGELSNGQVRVIVENLIDRHVAKLAEMQHVVVDALVGLSVKETNEVMADWRARADALDDTKPPEPELSLHHSQTFGGRYVTNGSFDGQQGSVIATALAVADSKDLNTPANQRRARALVAVAQFFLDHHDTATTPRQRPHVSIVIDAKDLAHGNGGSNPDTGDRYDPATVARFLCDCTVNRVIAEKTANAVTRILDMGTDVRTATPAQRRALAVRDGGCRWPACDTPGAWCEAHHVIWADDNGPTDLDNLVLLCGKHHTEIHKKPDLALKLLPDATLEVTYPSGLVRTSRPPGALDPLPI